MWYVIAEFVPGVRSYYGAYKEESDADTVAEKVNGVAVRIKDWKKYAKVMNATQPKLR